MINQFDFISLGLYEDGKLLGFATGYATSHVTFYFAGIYVKNRNETAKLLIEFLKKLKLWGTNLGTLTAIMKI